MNHVQTHTDTHIHATVRLMSLIPTSAPVSDTDTSTNRRAEAVQPDPTDSDTYEGISQRNGTQMHQKNQVVYILKMKSVVLILSTTRTESRLPCVKFKKLMEYGDDVRFSHSQCQTTRVQMFVYILVIKNMRLWLVLRDIPLLWKPTIWVQVILCI